MAATIPRMADLQIAHTSDLDDATLRAAPALLAGVFEGRFDELDWEHALGGVHALIWERSELIGHASVIQRRLVHGGRALRTGYVEGVAVRADRRGRGHAATMMAALERVIRAAYDLGALGSSDMALEFYVARGWHRWRGPLSALAPDGVRPTPEEQGGIFVLPCAAPLDLDGELTCDHRDGDAW
jgi:aminoglycoside 2'-N-acetyltransferase I